MALKIAIIGLGYVGLPLARVFAQKYATVGYDINSKRISDLQNGVDETQELTFEQLNQVLDKNPYGLKVSHNITDLSTCNFFVITVPTPVDDKHKPNLKPLTDASFSIGNLLKKGDIVVYESTVFPGATEEICVPILEKQSGLILNVDFHVGYSPERINPADKEHTVDKIRKVTSGSSSSAAMKIDEVYASVITAGTYLAPSIKVAEAAKVIENSQRDINIAFVNELAKIFNLLNIDTQEVLKAAATKWNFLPFQPGLVGGHCIGVDPYYLAQKAQEVGYHPEIILAGRRMNDSMGGYVAGEIIKLMLSRDIPITGSRVLVMGLTFKENCPDVRNTKVMDLISHLKEYGLEVEVWDPIADRSVVETEYQLSIYQQKPLKQYDVLVLAVAHAAFLDLDFNVLKKDKAVIYDVKGVLGNLADKRL